jgi:hypothetical protein
MPRTGESTKKQREEVDKEYEPVRNPTGIYSGPSKRVAFSDGTFAPVKDKPEQPSRKLPPPNEE